MASAQHDNKVQKVRLKKKSGFCFSDLPHKILQQVRKYFFAKFRYLGKQLEGDCHQPQWQQSQVLHLRGGLATSSTSVHREQVHLKPGEDGGESLPLLAKCQLCGLNQQRGQQKTLPPEKNPRIGTTEGGGQRGSQVPSTSGATTAWGKKARDLTTTSGVYSPQQADDRKHPVLLRRGGGGRRASGAGQPGWNGSHTGRS